MALMCIKNVNVWPSRMTNDLDQFRLLARNQAGAY